ncbi:YdcF family protein [Cellulosilyticum ruminicola]|uniref:hypothetical protein n=1 Tax=Cellulosilyticum ruminicola TaxID=425254 RepID=UPI0012EEA883|nr:hypothetical protein [Cellulosilyticum ruminicola]
MFIVALSSFILVEGCIVLREMGFDVPQNSDYLIVLGTRVRGEKISLFLKARLDKALCEYLNENPNTQVILSGAND